MSAGDATRAQRSPRSAGAAWRMAARSAGALHSHPTAVSKLNTSFLNSLKKRFYEVQVERWDYNNYQSEQFFFLVHRACP